MPLSHSTWWCSYLYILKRSVHKILQFSMRLLISHAGSLICEIYCENCNKLSHRDLSESQSPEKGPTFLGPRFCVLEPSSNFKCVIRDILQKNFRFTHALGQTCIGRLYRRRLGAKPNRAHCHALLYCRCVRTWGGGVGLVVLVQ